MPLVSGHNGRIEAPFVLDFAQHSRTVECVDFGGAGLWRAQLVGTRRGSLRPGCVGVRNGKGPGLSYINVAIPHGLDPFEEMLLFRRLANDTVWRSIP
jgi:hypothetical protein